MQQASVWETNYNCYSTFKAETGHHCFAVDGDITTYLIEKYFFDFSSNKGEQTCSQIQYHGASSLKQEVLSLQSMIPPKRFDISPPD